MITVKEVDELRDSFLATPWAQSISDVKTDDPSGFLWRGMTQRHVRVQNTNLVLNITPNWVTLSVAEPMAWRELAKFDAGQVEPLNAPLPSIRIGNAGPDSIIVVLSPTVVEPKV